MFQTTVCRQAYCYLVDRPATHDVGCRIRESNTNGTALAYEHRSICREINLDQPKSIAAPSMKLYPPVPARVADHDLRIKDSNQMTNMNDMGSSFQTPLSFRKSGALFLENSLHTAMNFTGTTVCLSSPKYVMKNGQIPTVL